MNGKENPLELLIMCVILLVLSVFGILGGFSRDLFGNIDGLLILAICLMMALISVLLFFGLAKEQGWIGKHTSDSSTTAPVAKAK